MYKDIITYMSISLRDRDKRKEKRSLMLSIKNWPEDERPRERLIKYGPESLSDAHLLGILLRTGSGKDGKNAIDLGREILNRFGNLSALDAAAVREICQIRGVGLAKAVQVKASIELGKRVVSVHNGGLPRFKCCDDVASYYMPVMHNLKREQFRCVLLDGKNRVIKETKVSEGSLTTSVVHPREVFIQAIRESAVSVILVHNHPSGDPSPSQEDLKITERLVRAGEIIGIKVLDHIIIGDKRFFSFAQENVL
jgi:DNA repair protein RadC